VRRAQKNHARMPGQMQGVVVVDFGEAKIRRDKHGATRNDASEKSSKRRESGAQPKRATRVLFLA